MMSWVCILSTFVVVSTNSCNQIHKSVNIISAQKKAKRVSPNTKICRKREKESRMRKEGSMTQITFKRKANPHDLVSGYILNFENPLLVIILSFSVCCFSHVTFHFIVYVLILWTMFFLISYVKWIHNWLRFVVFSAN